MRRPARTPISQFNVIFKNEEFQNIVPWLMLNRDCIELPVDPLTESSYDDQGRNAAGARNAVVADQLDILRLMYRAELLPKDAAHPA